MISRECNAEDHESCTGSVRPTRALCECPCHGNAPVIDIDLTEDSGDGALVEVPSENARPESALVGVPTGPS